MKRVCQVLVGEGYSSNLKCMIPSSSQSIEDRLFADVVVHAVTVFIGNSNLDILQPFNKLLEDPGQLQVCIYTYVYIHMYPLSMILDHIVRKD